MWGELLESGQRSSLNLSHRIVVAFSSFSIENKYGGFSIECARELCASREEVPDGVVGTKDGLDGLEGRRRRCLRAVYHLS
eukprot:SAG11_NODE_2686_length_3095_cov_2.431431_2_plen_81_part_00